MWNVIYTQLNINININSLIDLTISLDRLNTNYVILMKLMMLIITPQWYLRWIECKYHLVILLLPTSLGKDGIPKSTLGPCLQLLSTYPNKEWLTKLLQHLWFWLSLYCCILGPMVWLYCTLDFFLGRKLCRGSEFDVHHRPNLKRYCLYICEILLLESYCSRGCTLISFWVVDCILRTHDWVLVAVV